MASGRISFDLPVWHAEIYHSERGATNPWMRAFNVVEIDDERENFYEALKTALALFEEDGLAKITIYGIQIGKLETMGGEEDA